MRDRESEAWLSRLTVDRRMPFESVGSTPETPMMPLWGLEPILPVGYSTAPRSASSRPR